MTNVPESESVSAGTPKAQQWTARRGIVGGVVLITIGIMFLAENLIPGFSAWDYWPLILVAIGGALLWKSRSS
jgi:hypothetical protein